MKVQTTAQIEALFIDGASQDLSDSKTVELEFSAIDTGGGFKDPILDFSVTLDKLQCIDFSEGQTHEIEVTLADPGNEDNEAGLSYEGVLKKSDDGAIEINGRLKEDQLSRTLIGFILQRLR